MSCAVCRTAPPVVGVLCERCQAALLGGVELTPEQIVAHIVAASRAALIDEWGRIHRLAGTTRIGRVASDETLCVLTPTVSRRHATITRVDSGPWRVRDLDSANATFVDDKRAVGEVVVTDRARLRIGRIGFYFVGDATLLDAPSGRRTVGATIRPASEGESARSTLEYAAEAEREVLIEFSQPIGGGGAVMRIGDTSVQLTIAQHDLIVLLAQRMLDERESDESIRGFISIEELLARLSLDSSEAATDNVRQLVRRVRRLLEKAGVGDLIETRPGRGYRLQVVPKLSARIAR